MSKDSDVCVEKLTQYTSLTRGIIIAMSRFPSFQSEVLKTEIPNEKWILDFWKRKIDVLGPLAKRVANKERIINEFGIDAHLAIRDEYKIAREFANSLERYFFMLERRDNT